MLFRYIQNKLETEPGCWWYGFAFLLLSVVLFIALVWSYVRFF